MTKYERYLVDLAVQVLREVMKMPRMDQRPSTPIRLALRVVLPHCPERWPVTQFWEGINSTHEIGRSQSVTASFNGIVRQLKSSGAWTEGQDFRPGAGAAL